MNLEKLRQQTETVCMQNFGCTLSDASEMEAYRAVCIAVREILVKKNHDFRKQRSADSKRVYYMSMEFLVGTSLRNNLFNLGIEDDMRKIVKDAGKDLDRLYDTEPDAGLGNGGLGRLASCYMDAASSSDYMCTGFSIKYEFGIFRQKIVDGWQMEFPDDWLNNGGVWLVPRHDDAVPVRFGGEAIGRIDENGKYRVDQVGYNTVMAIPYDMYISGYDSKAVNKLTLWEAKSPNCFDMSAFSRGEYAKALEQETMAEVISKVLYPADNHIEGKRLRLRQQYLLVSASMQSIIKDHLRKNPSLDSLPDKVAIHINDTHPALCEPELMRILVDEYDYEWDKAGDITCRTLSYTNHTVMSEALERWSESLYSEQMPRIYQITSEINRRLLNDLRAFYGDDRPKLDYMAVIANGEVRMANLCLACCHKVNGVSKLHSQILTDSIFRDYYVMNNDRFTNVTNGIAYRRWLCQSNPLLTSALTELIGDGFKKDSTELEKLLNYRDDNAVLDRLYEIKHANKVRLAYYIEKANGIIVDPDSIFDIQIKRLHEYKRQLLNALQILRMYISIKNDPNAYFRPRTFVFAAKASAGYVMAKQIIRLICAIANLVNSDPAARDKLKVVFLEDYKVSLAEIIIPAADISEQISIAGKEASGTGNMKLMINGAVTLGTLDGANVEIHEQVGDENMFLFGMTADEVEELWRKGYNPMEYINRVPELKAVIDMLMNGINGNRFDDIVYSLLRGNYSPADAYMSMADFTDYVRAQNDISAAYGDRRGFTKKSLVNIAKAGIFSADRAVKEYADSIWHLK
ncbi:MAG: glycogen/starch/alpha-glucan phosphorylase [Firmicutes bacterium]|nr:glycogen/starch/alpha-glucan phosphorylase [Candidatus Colimorpha enterica]